MKTFVGILSALLCITSPLYGQTDVLNGTQSVRLRDLAREWGQQYKVEREQALIKAKQKSWPTFNILPNNSVIEIQGLDDGGRPIYHHTQNVYAAQTVSTDRVWPGGSLGLNLSGDGMTIGEWDGGAVRGTHQELTGRVTQADGATTIINHSTHVAGTMIAAGVSTTAKGMSWQGHLLAYDWDNDVSEMASAAASGLLLSNHSYGIPQGWATDGYYYYWLGDTRVSTTEDYMFGFYDGYARMWDSVAALAPYYLMVAAAGNDRDETYFMGSRVYYIWDYTNGQWVESILYRPSDGPHDCVSHYAVAKNVLSVGAVYEIRGGYTAPRDVVMSTFSSWGPTDDGRIKPDIVGKGVFTFSCIGREDNAYDFMDGTSMASPNVAGSLLLLQQHFKNTHSSNSMRASTLKGLAIHTADEAGSSNGPDYKYGWGLLNTAKAASLISRDWDGPFIREETLSNGSTYSFEVYVPGTEPLVATMCWTDPPGTCPAPSLNPRTKMLVNDLDLRILRGGTTYYPWVLDVDHPDVAATTDDNNIDNVEKVYVALPTQGWYTVQVTHKGTLQGGQQQFALITSGWVRPSVVGLPICLAGDSQQNQQIVSDGSGGAIVVWQDGRNGPGRNTIYAQKIDASGQIAWTQNGVPICGYMGGGGGDQRSPQLVSDGAGGAIITWQGNRPAIYPGTLIDIWAQRVNADGTVAWPVNGKIVLSKTGDQVNPRIASTGGGGSIIVCEDRFNPPNDINVVAQKLNANGDQQWGTEGIMVCSGNGTQTEPELVSDGAGGAICTWTDSRTSMFGDIYAQRLDANGSIHAGWTTDGIPVCTSTTGDYSPAIVTDGASGAVIAWQSISIPQPYYVRAQHIDANGSIHANWPTNGLTLGTATYGVRSFDIASDGAGGAFLAWSAQTAGPITLYARLVTGSGTLPWPAKTISGPPEYSASPGNPAIVADGVGGAFITWADSRTLPHTGTDIYAQRVDGAGVAAWQENGIPVSTVINNQTFPVLASHGPGDVLIAWTDYRSGTMPDIYAQHVRGAMGGLNVSFSISLAEGWNMISNPVTVANDSVRVLYPTSAFNYAYSFNGAYVQDYTMENGTGYWEKFSSAITQHLTGMPILRDTLNVLSGWNMVGTISNPVDTGTIVSVPPSLRGSLWYGYNGAYFVAPLLIPGQAYWVKANSAGQFVLAQALLARVANVQLSGVNPADMMNTLTITDSKGRSQTLLFGADASKSIQSSMYVMPPLPPVGAFDARFETSDGGSMVQTHGAEASAGAEFTVAIQSDAYPLTVTWNVKNSSYSLTDGQGGKVFSPKEMNGVGTFWIANSSINKISVTLTGGTQLPKEFALLQNYPNPFNPSTTIEYDLPINTRACVNVFNILGQEVATLVNEEQKAGHKSVEWNANNFASGVYFYRIQAGDFVASKKLLFLK